MLYNVTEIKLYQSIVFKVFIFSNFGGLCQTFKGKVIICSSLPGMVIQKYAACANMMISSTLFTHKNILVSVLSYMVT